MERYVDRTATTGSPLHTYGNGRQVTGSPGALTFHGHDETALVYGAAPAQIPGGYAFGDLSQRGRHCL